jgi:flagellar biosynthesis protein FlhG
VYDDDIPIDFEDFPSTTARARLLVVGGGRGGVGKSFVAHNLAIYLAQLGKNVALVDQDPAGANIHTAFQLPSSTELATEDLTSALLDTEVPGLKFLPFAHESSRRAPILRGSRLSRAIEQVRALPADFIVVNAGAPTSDQAIATMLQADLAIVVTATEPTAIEATYRFLRNAYMRELRRSLKGSRLQLTFLERYLSENSMIPAPLDIARGLTSLDAKLGEHAWLVARSLRFHLVVNFTRNRSDSELGVWMHDLVLRHYGVELTELGHIEYDDAVWVSARKKRPLILDNPTTKAARSLERVARRTLAVIVTQEAEGGESTDAVAELKRDPATRAEKLAIALKESIRGVRTSGPGDAIPTGQPNFYALLGIPRGCAAEEIRRAYKKRREVHASDSLVTHAILSPEVLRQEQLYLDEAYDTLLDPIRRRAYDLSVFPEEQGTDFPVAEVRLPPTAEQRNAHENLLRTIGPDTEFSGELLRRFRETLAIPLTEISAQTRISKAYLEAIENEHVDRLPAPVYVRGFVVELAKALKLDPNQVQRTYLRRLGRESRP